MHSGRRPFICSILGTLASLPLTGQQPYVPKQSDRPEALHGDEPGFQSIFDGKTPGRMGRRSQVLAGRATA